MFKPITSILSWLIIRRSAVLSQSFASTITVTSFVTLQNTSTIALGTDFCSAYPRCDRIDWASWFSAITLGNSATQNGGSVTDGFITLTNSGVIAPTNSEVVTLTNSGALTPTNSGTELTDSNAVTGTVSTATATVNTVITVVTGFVMQAGGALAGNYGQLGSGGVFIFAPLPSGAADTAAAILELLPDNTLISTTTSGDRSMFARNNDTEAILAGTIPRIFQVLHDDLQAISSLDVLGEFYFNEAQTMRKRQSTQNLVLITNGTYIYNSFTSKQIEEYHVFLIRDDVDTSTLDVEPLVLTTSSTTATITQTLPVVTGSSTMRTSGTLSISGSLVSRSASLGSNSGVVSLTSTPTASNQQTISDATPTNTTGGASGSSSRNSNTFASTNASAESSNTGGISRNSPTGSTGTGSTQSMATNSHQSSLNTGPSSSGGSSPSGTGGSSSASTGGPSPASTGSSRSSGSSNSATSTANPNPVSGFQLEIIGGSANGQRLGRLASDPQGGILGFSSDTGLYVTLKTYSSNPVTIGEDGQSNYVVFDTTNDIGLLSLASAQNATTRLLEIEDANIGDTLTPDTAASGMGVFWRCGNQWYVTSAGGSDYSYRDGLGCDTLSLRLVLPSGSTSTSRDTATGSSSHQSSTVSGGSGVTTSGSPSASGAQSGSGSSTASQSTGSIASNISGAPGVSSSSQGTTSISSSSAGSSGVASSTSSGIPSATSSPSISSQSPSAAMTTTFTSSDTSEEATTTTSTSSMSTSSSAPSPFVIRLAQSTSDSPSGSRLITKPGPEASGPLIMSPSLEAPFIQVFVLPYGQSGRFFLQDANDASMYVAYNSSTPAPVSPIFVTDSSHPELAPLIVEAISSEGGALRVVPALSGGFSTPYDCPETQEPNSARVMAVAKEGVSLDACRLVPIGFELYEPWTDTGLEFEVNYGLKRTTELLQPRQEGTRLGSYADQDQNDYLGVSLSNETRLQFDVFWDSNSKSYLVMTKEQIGRYPILNRDIGSGTMELLTSYNFQQQLPLQVMKIENVGDPLLINSTYGAGNLLWYLCNEYYIQLLNADEGQSSPDCTAVNIIATTSPIPSSSTPSPPTPTPVPTYASINMIMDSAPLPNQGVGSDQYVKMYSNPELWSSFVFRSENDDGTKNRLIDAQMGVGGLAYDLLAQQYALMILGDIFEGQQAWVYVQNATFGGPLLEFEGWIWWYCSDTGYVYVAPTPDEDWRFSACVKVDFRVDEAVSSSSG